MKIKITLSKKQFKDLYQLYKSEIKEATPTQLPVKLVILSQKSLCNKMYQLDANEKPKYNLSFDEMEAIGFVMCWYNHKFENESSIGNLLNTLLSVIHPKII